MQNGHAGNSVRDNADEDELVGCSVVRAAGLGGRPRHRQSAERAPSEPFALCPPVVRKFLEAVGLSPELPDYARPMVVIREDENLRRREPGEAAGLIREGVDAAVAAGARATTVIEEWDEVQACKVAMSHANPGDIVAMAVDQHADVMRALEEFTHRAQPAPKDGGLMVADPDLG